MFAIISDAVLVAIVAAIANVVALLIGMWKIRVSVETVHGVINSRMTDLLLLTKNASHAEGVKEGKNAQIVEELIARPSPPTPDVPLTEARLIEILATHRTP